MEMMDGDDEAMAEPSQVGLYAATLWPNAMAELPAPTAPAPDKKLAPSGAASQNQGGALIFMLEKQPELYDARLHDRQIIAELSKKCIYCWILGFQFFKQVLHFFVTRDTGIFFGNSH